MQDLGLETGQPTDGRVPPPWPSINQTGLRCRTCNAFGQPYLNHKAPHIEARCVTCNAFIQFVPRRPNWLALYFAQWKVQL